MPTALIGCGYVADSYMLTLPRSPELALTGAFDRDASRTSAFSRFHGTRDYCSIEELLDDANVEAVLNLTNPRSHYEVTKTCLERGKHVYSEKPLGMNLSEAQRLAALARERGLQLASAPCSVLGETAQTMWKALRDGLIGKVRLVIANFDDGMIAPHLQPWNWMTPSGAHWPAKDEFEVGCTFEHAGYFLTWLAAFFGPARRVTAFASTQLPDKGIPVDRMAPDFTNGCIEYDHGVVARVTCSLVAPHDKSLTIIGDKGILRTHHLRDDASPVYLRSEPCGRILAGIERRLNAWQPVFERLVPWWPLHEWRFMRRLPFARTPSPRIPRGHKRVDFCRGPVELARAIRENRDCRLSPELGTHITELVEALQHPGNGGTRPIDSTFPPIKPLPCD